MAIAELENQLDWLQAIDWKVSQGGRLTVDFEITHLESAIAFSMTYPNFFPDMPPQVCPREPVRISGHQYGEGGELCLEYRPDNWDPSYTGAMMIESCHRLLTGETPAAGEQGYVESAHRITPGQQARGTTLRFLLPAAARAAIAQLPLFQPAAAEVSETNVAKKWLAFPRRFGSEGEIIWDGSTEIPSKRPRTGYVVRIPPVSGKIPASYEFVEAMVGMLKRPDLSERFECSKEELVLLIGMGDEVKLLSLAPGSGKRHIYGYHTIEIPADADRLPAAYGILSQASVAVVGCGSLGSKIAASLARAGVGNFTLVDGDLLFPANLVRHDLDWRYVGLDKCYALAARIRNIRPSAVVSSRQILLGGQESSASTEAAMQQVAGCQLIIDATAEPNIFNLCAAVARTDRIPLVWGEVFGGGVGGLMMRLRPDLDPVPHAARRQVLQWCADRGVEPQMGGTGQYGLALAGGDPPLIADDADVGVIAAHVTRLALDLLVRPDSLFPHSAYAVGLKQEWIFSAPFDTWPIELKAEGDWGPVRDEGWAEELSALAAELLPSDEGAGDSV